MTARDVTALHWGPAFLAVALALASSVASGNEAPSAPETPAPGSSVVINEYRPNRPQDETGKVVAARVAKPWEFRFATC